MEITSYQMIHFLQDQLAVPTDAIPVILQYCEQTPCRLPVVLWQQKLVTLAQLDTVFDWLTELAAVSALQLGMN